MPTHKQTTVESTPTERFMGRSASNDLGTAYPTSPMVLGDMTDDERRQWFQDNVLDAVINDGGHTFGELDTSYTNAPDLADVETGGGGLPGSAYVPNPVSPGPGSHNPTDVGEPPEGWGQKPSDTWGSGVGSQLQPKAASEKISGQTLGAYILGKSSAE